MANNKHCPSIYILNERAESRNNMDGSKITFMNIREIAKVEMVKKSYVSDMLPVQDGWWWRCWWEQIFNSWNDGFSFESTWIVCFNLCVERAIIRLISMFIEWLLEQHQRMKLIETRFYKLIHALIFFYKLFKCFIYTFQHVLPFRLALTAKLLDTTLNIVQFTHKHN